jgi:hypothetical protein
VDLSIIKRTMNDKAPSRPFFTEKGVLTGDRHRAIAWAMVNAKATAFKGSIFPI